MTAGAFSTTDKAESTMGRDINSLKSDHEEADKRVICTQKRHQMKDMKGLLYVARTQMCLFC